MMTAEENDLLCRVEGNAPMGQLMRRHWIPAALSEQLLDNDGDPIRLRLLGEDLVAFRDSDGRVGIMDAHCPHRGAPMHFARRCRKVVTRIFRRCCITTWARRSGRLSTNSRKAD